MKVGIQCPQCRGTNTHREYTYGNGFLKCHDCGWAWR